MEDFLKQLLFMTPEEVIKSLLEDEVLNTVLPVMSGVDAIA